MEDADGAELQAKVRERIWQAIGADPSLVDGAICPAGDAGINPWDIFDCENSDASDCKDADIDSVALRSVTLWRVAYTQSMTGAVASERAYDLGDGFWYIFQLPDPDDGSPYLCIVAP